MDLSRRKMLAATAGSIGALLFNPARVLGWGSFDGMANTHASIVETAMGRISSDPGFGVLGFPTVRQIMSYDWVSLDGNLSMSGTGPDADGSSLFSEHYYNPETQQGGGPDAVGKHYKNLVSNTIQHKTGDGAAKSAAWAAHFLSDMHVPYHTAGIPAWLAHQRKQADIGNLSLAESGPALLYIASPVPDGWGGNQRFHKALDAFTAYHPLKINGKVGTTDWYDPWYYNGYGIQESRILTGSHAMWEKQAHKLWSQGIYETYLNHILSISRYDPDWKNPRIKLVKKHDPGVEFYNTAKRFAAVCAQRTRNNIEPFFNTPGYAISYAVRAVMTMFKASVTTIKIEPIRPEQVDGNNCKATCNIVNMNTLEALENVVVLFRWTFEDGRSHDNIVKLSDPIRPGARSGAWWQVPFKPGEKIQLACAVTGEYQTTPDMGYNIEQITISTRKIQPEPDPVPTPQPSPQPIKSTNCSSITISVKRDTSNNSIAGAMYHKVDVVIGILDGNRYVHQVGLFINGQFVTIANRGNGWNQKRGTHWNMTLDVTKAIRRGPVEISYAAVDNNKNLICKGSTIYRRK